MHRISAFPHLGDFELTEPSAFGNRAPAAHRWRAGQVREHQADANLKHGATPMLEATTESITTAAEKNPDAALLKLIAKYDDLSSEALRLDEESITAQRIGELSKAKELTARYDKTFNKACALHWELLTRDAITADGHAAKVRMIVSSSFDPEDLIAIAWRLGHEAGRLGLTRTMPRLTPPAGRKCRPRADPKFMSQIMARSTRGGPFFHFPGAPRPDRFA